jgi:hypothetical protein
LAKIKNVQNDKFWIQIEALLEKFEGEFQQEELLKNYITSISKEKTTIENLKVAQGNKKMTLALWETLVEDIDMDDSVEDIKLFLKL